MLYRKKDRIIGKAPLFEDNRNNRDRSLGPKDVLNFLLGTSPSKNNNSFGPE